MTYEEARQRLDALTYLNHIVSVLTGKPNGLVEADRIAVDLDEELLIQVEDAHAQHLLELADIEQARLDRITENVEIRAMIADINNSNDPPWRKKLLRRLVRDMRD